MKVLIACEFSGVVRRAFRKLGHDAYSCDILPSDDDSEYHVLKDALGLLDLNGWDLLIAHPPCTYLTNAGVRHLHSHVTSVNGVRAKVHGEARMQAMREGAFFFNALKNCNIPKICVENPIPHKYAREIIGKYDQLIQPWQFGHGETKATCLWLKNLPKLIPTNIVADREARIHKMAPGPNRSKERSRTFQGIADAMADQWG